MKNKRVLYLVLLVCGIILLCVGAYVIKSEQLKSISGVFIGIGAGCFGLATGELIKMRFLKKHPDYKRKIDIEAADERTVYINTLAKAKTFDIMGTIYGILMLIFILMNQSLITIVLLVSVYILSWVIYFVFLNKYSQQM